MEQVILALALWAVPVILAITIHEAAHGYAARHYGDPTAYQAGRISLNPLRHIDPVGTLLIPGAIVLLNAVLGVNFPPFGWAKPVPVNFGRLRRPKQDMLWVAAAGPGSNLVQAFLWALVGRLLLEAEMGESWWMVMTQNGILANLVLMLINLVPIPPLDGGRIAVSLLPHRQAWQLSRLEPYGFFILIALLYLNILDRVLWALIPPLRQFLHLLTGA